MIEYLHFFCDLTSFDSPPESHAKAGCVQSQILLKKKWTFVESNWVKTTLSYWNVRIDRRLPFLKLPVCQFVRMLGRRLPVREGHIFSGALVSAIFWQRPQLRKQLPLRWFVDIRTWNPHAPNMAIERHGSLNFSEDFGWTKDYVTYILATFCTDHYYPQPLPWNRVLFSFTSRKKHVNPYQPQCMH